MYDAWIDDILDDVRNNVVGEYWHVYFDEPFLRKSLKHLLQQSKLDYEHKYPSKGPILLFKYENDYEVEKPSKTLNYLMNNLVVDNTTSNDLHTAYYFILKQIVKTQGEDNILTESATKDRQKKYIDNIINYFVKGTKLVYNKYDDEDELETPFLKYSVPIDVFVAENKTSRTFNEHCKNIFGLTNAEKDYVWIEYRKIIREKIKDDTIEKIEDTHIERFLESLSSRVNKDVDELFSKNKNLSNEKEIKSIFMDEYGMNKQDADQAMVIYLSKQQSLNESEDNQKEYLDRVVDRLLKESEYRIWKVNSINPNLKRIEKSNKLRYIAVEIKFGLPNIWRDGESEYFDMFQIRKEASKDQTRKYEHIEEYEKEHLNNIYGLSPVEMLAVIYSYYTKLYRNIYKSYLEMGKDDKVPTSIPEKWIKGDEVFEVGGRLNESTDKQGRYLDWVVEKLFEDTGFYTTLYDGWLHLPNTPNSKYDVRKILEGDTYMYNRFLAFMVKYCRDVYGLNDNELSYIWVNYIHTLENNFNHLKDINESTEKPKGMDINFLFKIADSIIKNDIEVDESTSAMGKSRAYGSFTEFSTSSQVFWAHLLEHAMEIYGLTESEAKTLVNLIWDSLNSKNVYQISASDLFYSTSRKFRDTLTEQHYNDWDERSIEQNKKKFKDRGITILSTDTRVPFYKRIDSKEIRFLKKIVDILDKQTKVVEVEDFLDSEYPEYIVYSPFGDFYLAELLDEPLNRRFENFVKDIYGVGDNQLIFPTHNSISQIGENYFLYEMYKEKLKRKQIQLVNPGLDDISDDAIIIEQDLSDDEHTSLLKSFEYMDTPEETATEELGNMITWVKDLPEELFLYRVLYLDDEKQINYDELGSHYSQDRTDLINNHYNRGSIYGHGQGENAYLITVKVPKSEVDVMETLNNNILYPHEKEITLKDKGRGATYLDIEKI